MPKRYLLAFWILLLSLSTIQAQEGETDQITTADIAYGDVVEDTITTGSFYDHWIFYGTQDEVVVIRMSASEGLAPLIGVINQGGNLLTRSDLMEDGSLVNPSVNSVSELRFIVPQDGEYTVVATRAGLNTGTTTGRYRLALTLEQAVSVTDSDLQDVVFRCGEHEITTAMTMEFNSEGDDGEYYRITVYGLDGFQPYIRIDIPFDGDTGDPTTTDCTSEGKNTVGDQYTLPSQATVTVEDGSPYTAQHVLTGMQEIGQLTLIIGSRDGAAGRYIAVIEGFSINQPADRDNLNVRVGPLARDSEMLIYMIRAPDTRIDPQVWMLAQNPAIDFVCDDAGRFDCADIPAAALYEFSLSDGTTIAGSRLDAGVRIATGNPDRVALQFRSRSATTSGDYSLVIVGELPEKEG